LLLGCFGAKLGLILGCRGSVSAAACSAEGRTVFSLFGRL